MGNKKVIKLTEEELVQIINESVKSVLNEFEGSTHARVRNTTKKITALNQAGIYDTPIANKSNNPNNPNKVIDHFHVLKKAVDTKRRADQALIKSYGDITFHFYATDRNDVNGTFDFKPSEIKKLAKDETILYGDIEYENEPFKGNILINFINNDVYYIARKTRYRYPLEVDNRTKKEWEIFIAELKASIDNRMTPEEIETYVNKIKSEREKDGNYTINEN